MDSHRDRALGFLIDETSLDIARALASVRRDVVHPGHSHLSDVQLGAKDTEWMPVIAGMDLVVISRDASIRRRFGELTVYRSYGLRSFWIAGRIDPPGSSWVYLHRVVRMWDAMEDTITKAGTGPWAFAINEKSITALAIPNPRPPRDARAR